MTQEEKELLLKDLCARLPYNTQGEGTYEEEVWHNGFPCSKKVTGYIEGIDHIGFDDGEIYVTVEGIQCELCDVKLYLRPMSSMTQDEMDKFQQCLNIIENENYGDGWSPAAWGQMAEFIHYCNEHHLDYNGLIAMGLALEAPKEMYND